MTLYRNGRIFTTAEPAWAESMVVDDGVLTFVGDDAAAKAFAPDAETVDLNGAFVLPGFIDSHTHLVAFGESLSQVDLMGTANLSDMQPLVQAAVAAAPDAVRILGRNWLPSSIPGGAPPGIACASCFDVSTRSFKCAVFCRECTRAQRAAPHFSRAASACDFENRPLLARRCYPGAAR